MGRWSAINIVEATLCNNRSPKSRRDYVPVVDSCRACRAGTYTRPALERLPYSAVDCMLGRMSVNTSPVGDQDKTRSGRIAEPGTVPLV
jgi:hypothetical protein